MLSKYLKAPLKHPLINVGIKAVLIRLSISLIGMAVGLMLARGLGVEGYGIYAYAISIISVMVMIGNFGFPTLITRSAASQSTHPKWHTLRAMLARLSQVSSVIILLMSLLSLWLLWLLSTQISTQQIMTFLWLLLLLPVLVFRNIITATLYGLNHLIANQVITKLMPAILLFVSIAALFQLSPATRQPEYVAFINLVISAITLLFAAVFLWRKLPQEFWQEKSVYHTKQWLLEALPFTLLVGVGVVNTQVDVLMLGLYEPIAQVGIYRVAAQMSIFALMGLQVINSIIAPQIVQRFLANKQQQLQYLMTISARIAFIFALAVMVCLLLFGKLVIVYLLGESYLEAYPALMVLNVGILISAVTGSIVLLAKMTGNEKKAVHTLAISAGLNILLNLVLIPFYGIIGAAIATSISMIFRNIHLYYVIKSTVTIRSAIF